MFERWHLTEEEAMSIATSRSYYEEETWKATKVFIFSTILGLFGFMMQSIIYSNSSHTYSLLFSFAYHLVSIGVVVGGALYLVSVYVYFIVLKVKPVFGVRHPVITKVLIVLLVVSAVIFFTNYLAYSSANKKN